VPLGFVLSLYGRQAGLVPMVRKAGHDPFHSNRCIDTGLSTSRGWNGMARTLLVIAGLTLACNEATSLDPGRPVTLGFEDYVFQTDNGARIEAQFGRLWLEPSAGVSRQSVAFVRLPATTPTPGPPIIYLAGGPGGSGIATGRGERFAYFQALRALSDVILYDQRGTGSSTPGVDCARHFDTPLDRALDRAAWSALWSEQAAQCAADLRARGIDLESYNTERNADDIDELRAALGIDKLVVIGYSYGTHLALAYIRRHGEHVTQAVLHGVEGPDHTLKLPSNVQRDLETIDSLAAVSPRSLAIGGFLDTLTVLLDRLEARPESLMVGDTLVVFGRFEAEVLVSGALGNREDVEELPGIVQAVARYGWAPAGAAVVELKRLAMNSGMSYATDCASGATASRLARIAAETPNTLLADAINFPFPEICSGWDVPDLGDAFRAPIQSDIPILFVSGSIDGRTPQSNAIEVAMGFPNARHLLVELAGHNELATDSRVINAIVHFLEGDAIVPDVVRLSPLQFTVF
jgi:pimeloyl-ACP methyl ester carboxylesterase